MCYARLNVTELFGAVHVVGLMSKYLLLVFYSKFMTVKTTSRVLLNVLYISKKSVWNK
jgi:hypothetical protein